MIIKRSLYIATGAALFLCLASGMAYARGNMTQDFVTNASIANEFEIESSKLALKKSHNSDVKSFAQHMVDDHTKTGDKLNNALESSHTKASPADTLDSKHQKMLDKLKAANGNDFNRQYINMQANSHKEAISLFSRYSKHGKDKALRSFASDTLPDLKDHLKDVKQLSANQ